MKHLLFIITWLVCNLLMCKFADAQQTAETFFQRGIHYEEVEGQLAKAIAVYQEVLQKYPTNISVAAQAQLHIGLCYARLKGESLPLAESAFRTVIRKYPDQRDAVQLARAKLEELQFAISPKQKDSSDSSVEEIKIMLAQMDSSFDAKDIERYSHYFSNQFIVRRDTTIEKWKQRIQFRISQWKTLLTKSTILSIEPTGYNYVVTEKKNISGTDYEGRSKIFMKNSTMVYTLIKDTDRWKILEIRDVSLPAAYDSLTTTSNSFNRTGLLYVSHITRGIVTVIDPTADGIVGQIKSGDGTISIDFMPDGDKGYIANYSSSDVTVFDRKTGKTMATVPAGEHPTDLLLTGDAQYLLIAHESDEGIWILDTRYNQIAKRLGEGTGPLLRNEKYKKIYQSQIFTPYVFVIDPQTQAITKRIAVGGRPLGIALTPNQRFAYVANFDLNEVEKIDVEIDSVVARIPHISNARGIAISPDGKFAYVTNVVSSTLTIIDLANDSPSKTISVGRMPTAVTFRLDGKYAYVACQGKASVSVIDVQNSEYVRSIEVADNPINVQIK
jgi:YVTN family beta-propeller protein